MPRLTGPLFSLGASGAIGDTLVYASWKGVDYARTWVIPANPKSTDQKEVRGVFSTLNEMWKRMPIGARNPFIAAAEGQPLTDRNKHIQVNAVPLQGDANLNDLVMSIAGGQALPPATAIAADGADGTVTIVGTFSPAPVGYTPAALCAAAVLDGDPSPVLIRTTYYNDDTTSPYSFAITVGANGVHQVGVWCKWQRTSDLKYFYSSAVRSQVTVTGFV